jgi:hypothetical protein
VRVFRKRLGWFLAGAAWLLLVEGVCVLALIGALDRGDLLPMVLILVAPPLLVATWE